MAWKDKLIPATWRGVPFDVEATEASFGRRTVTHEYPQRDKPYVEDLGKATRELPVEAFLWGDSYLDKLQALIRALEEPGAGILEHPYFGRLTCTLKEAAKVRQSSAEGGMARVSMLFVEGGERAFPSAATDTRSVVGMKADSAVTATGTGFFNLFETAGFPGFVADGAVTNLVALADTVEGLRARLRDATDVSDVLAGTLDDFAAGARGYLSDPLDLAGRIHGLMQSLAASAAAPADAMAALLGMRTFGDDFADVPTSTPSRLREGQNQAAVIRIGRRAGIIEAARQSADREFGSYDEAVSVRDALAEALDDETLEAGDDGDDDSYVALKALKAAVVADITDRGGSLARVVDVTLPDDLPALVKAYDLYEDATRDQEIVDRNGIAHPGFIPAGTLQVLNA